GHLAMHCQYTCSQNVPSRAVRWCSGVDEGTNPVPGHGEEPAMRATFLYGTGDVRVDEVADPVLQDPTDAIVRVVRACVCGSDLHRYHDYSGEPRPMGHEFLGVV